MITNRISKKSHLIIIKINIYIILNYTIHHIKYINNLISKFTLKKIYLIKALNTY